MIVKGKKSTIVVRKTVHSKFQLPTRRVLVATKKKKNGKWKLTNRNRTTNKKSDIDSKLKVGQMNVHIPACCFPSVSTRFLTECSSLRYDRKTGRPAVVIFVRNVLLLTRWFHKPIRIPSWYRWHRGTGMDPSRRQGSKMMGPVVYCVVQVNFHLAQTHNPTRILTYHH